MFYGPVILVILALIPLKCTFELPYVLLLLTEVVFDDCVQCLVTSLNIISNSPPVRALICGRGGIDFLFLLFVSY